MRWRVGAAGQEVRRPIRHLFLFIGADPNTDWLAGSGVALDAKGFVLTGADAGTVAMRWRPAGAASSPSAMCAPGSIKRVAAAVGEGAQVVAALHAYLAEIARRRQLRRPAFRRQLEALEFETRRDGAAAQRPVAEAFRRLPGVSRHDGLRALA